jgi:hypothetical protein
MKSRKNPNTITPSQGDQVRTPKIQTPKVSPKGLQQSLHEKNMEFVM